MSTKGSTMKVIDSNRVQQAAGEGVPLIDVRPSSMFAEGHVPGAKNVPLVVPEDGSMYPDSEILSAVKAAGVQPEDDVVLYCQTGLHAGLAAETLTHNGYSNVEVYTGSMNDWTEKGLPTEA